ncbi:MAG: hypothetical protein ACOZCO_11565 [Bacteroidota bacterium]
MKAGFDYGNTEVVSYSDYYPFGQQMPGRNGGESYRFTGINGQEVEPEITGSNSHSSAEYWMYDSRLGRRWNQDPIIMPSQSRYATFNNNPVYFNDPTGQTGDVSIKKEQTTVDNGDETTSTYDGTITVTMDLYFYGEEADRLKATNPGYFSELATSIENDYNNIDGGCGKGSYTITGGENAGTYLIEFSIKGHYATMDQAFSIATNEGGYRDGINVDAPYQINLIRLEKDAGEYNHTLRNRSRWELVPTSTGHGTSASVPSNSGFFTTTVTNPSSSGGLVTRPDDLIGNKTGSHEIHHALFVYSGKVPCDHCYAQPGDIVEKLPGAVVTQNNINQIMGSVTWDTHNRGHIGTLDYWLFDKNSIPLKDAATNFSGDPNNSAKKAAYKNLLKGK